MVGQLEAPNGRIFVRAGIDFVHNKINLTQSIDSLALVFVCLPAAGHARLCCLSLRLDTSFWFGHVANNCRLRWIHYMRSYFTGTKGSLYFSVSVRDPRRPAVNCVMRHHVWAGNRRVPPGRFAETRSFTSEMPIVQQKKKPKRIIKKRENCLFLILKL